MEIKTRRIAATTYLSERQVVTPEQIPGFIQQSCERLAAQAPSAGGWDGPLTTIYHEAVDQDNDGEIENAVPVRGPVDDGDFAAPTSVLREPELEVAYARITKAQVAFPQILQAYDEVHLWLGEQGFTPTAKAREIYFTDFSAAGAEDEVCDVAVPFTR